MNQKVFAHAGLLYTFPEGTFIRRVTVAEEKLLERIGRKESFISNNHGPIEVKVASLPSNNGS